MPPTDDVAYGGGRLVPFEMYPGRPRSPMHDARPGCGAVPSHQEAVAFCARWLPLWTGNRPDALAALYTDDPTYRDPARPEGLRGRAELSAYLSVLLARHPDWVWEAGAVFHWRAGSCSGGERRSPCEAEWCARRGSTS